MTYMFYGDSGLDVLDISSFSTDQLTFYDNIFEGLKSGMTLKINKNKCSKLVNSIPDGVIVEES